jgi:hypothetical protein
MARKLLDIMSRHFAWWHWKFSFNTSPYDFEAHEEKFRTFKSQEMSDLENEDMKKNWKWQ